jgi:hypothetical protein
MLSVRACATPTDTQKTFLPKRLARVRRAAESKRMDSFKEIHEALKKKANEERAFVDELFKKAKDYLDADDEE